MKLITARLIMRVIIEIDEVQSAVMHEITKLLPVADADEVSELASVYRILQRAREELLPKYREAMRVEVEGGKQW